MSFGSCAVEIAIGQLVERFRPKSDLQGNLATQANHGRQSWLKC